MSNLENLFASLDNNSEPDKTRDIIRHMPFGWPGGKSKSIPKILPLLPYTQKYISVFGGSGVDIFARRKVKLEVFNDRYSGVTDFYRVIRTPELYQQLISRLKLTVHSREDFLLCKETWQNIDDPVERAARWYTMITYSFGCLGRNWGRSLNSKATLSGKILNKIQHFPELHERFKNVQIENQDFRQCLIDYDSSDAVFYLDPPYLNVYKGTHKYEMSLSDHKEMLNIIFSLQGFVALSGYQNELYDSYSWDNCFTWDVYVSIEGHGGKDSGISRTYAQECLWIKE